MSTTLHPPLADARPADARPAGGGAPARRAVIRWAWRLFRHEWRQQFLILALITVAVAATIVGSAVAINTPPPKNAGFGTARYSVSFPSYNAQAASVIAKLQHAGRVEVIENETLSIPGSINTYQLRAQEPRGPFSGPMLSLVSGHYPSGADQVAVTSGVASAFHLRVGTSWRVGGVERRVVGIVENPQSLLDEFALVVPGQVRNPTGVTALFDTPVSLSSYKGVQIQTPASVVQHESAQSRDDLAGRTGARDAPHRARLRRRLHGARTASNALDRDARVSRRDRSSRPSCRQRERHRRRRRRRDPRLSPGTRRLARLPSEPRTELAPPHRRARASVDRRRCGDGACNSRGVFRGVASRSGNHQGADRPGLVGPSGSSP